MIVVYSGITLLPCRRLSDPEILCPIDDGSGPEVKIENLPDKRIIQIVKDESEDLAKRLEEWGLNAGPPDEQLWDR